MCVGGGGYTQWLVKTIKWNSIIRQCPLKNFSNRAFHFLHPPCSIRMHVGNTCIKVFDSLSERFIICDSTQWKTNQSNNRSIDQSFTHCNNTCYGFLMLPWTWPVTVSLSFNGNWETVIHWLLSFTSSTIWLKIKNKRNIKNSSVLKSMCTSSFWQTSWS